jgi:hypothetical protein
VSSFVTQRCSGGSREQAAWVTQQEQWEIKLHLGSEIRMAWVLQLHGIAV